jgi:hypothetical protein
MGALAAPLMIAATAAGGAMQAYGQLREGQAAQATANYQAYIAEQNRKTALETARRTQEAAARDEEALRRKNAQLAGSQRANAAGSGIDLGSGSIADVFDDTVRLGEEDALTLRSKWWDDVNARHMEARNFGSEAQLTRMRGKQARSASYINATTSLLNTASSVSSKWGDWQKENPGKKYPWSK